MKKQGKAKPESRKSKHKPDKDPAIKVLGERIKQIRREKGYTSLYDFAYEHEISRGQYARFEQGANMTFLNFLKVSQALGVSLSDLFDGMEEKISTPKSGRK